MLCRNCGAEIPDNSKFCVECGTKIKTQPAGVDQQRVISDKHYSLDEIARQQQESNVVSSENSGKSGVNLNKTPPMEDTEKHLGSEPTSVSENQPVGAVTGEVYKMKSAGFDDEKEPVKRSSVTDPVNVPTQNNSFGGVPQQNNNTYGTNGTQPQNSNYSFGGVQSQNNNTYGTNGTQPQNSNYSFGGVQSQNNNTYGTNGTQPQNSNYSFGGVQSQNNTYGTNSAPTQNNNFSYNGTSQYNNGFANQNNQYSPTAVSSSSRKNSKAAIIMIIVAIVVVLALIGAIIFMVVSGYYNIDPDSPQNSNVPSVSDSPSISSNVPDVSNGENSAAVNEGNVDFSDVLYSNLANRSLATQDDKGNLYYCNDDSYICKIDSSGAKTKIYDAWSTCLNYYDDRLYFISKVDGYNTVCSIQTDGSDFKTHTSRKDVSMLVVSDGYAYYAINKYGSSSDSGALFEVNLSSGSVKNLVVEKNSIIVAIFAYGDDTYVHYMDIDTYVGSIDKIDKDGQISSINSPSNEYDYYSVTISNDKFYFITYVENSFSYDYVIYSMNMDGSDGKEIGGNNGEMIAIYGDYIYYTMDKYNGKEYPLYRMRIDGTGEELIYDENVSYMSIVGDKIYYLDYDTDEMKVMNLDGSENKVLD